MLKRIAKSELAVSLKIFFEIKITKWNFLSLVGHSSYKWNLKTQDVNVTNFLKVVGVNCRDSHDN